MIIDIIGMIKTRKNYRITYRAKILNKIMAEAIIYLEAVIVQACESDGYGIDFHSR